MAPHDAQHDAHHPVTDGLHPAIYAGLAVLSLWFVVSAWVFFGSEGSTPPIRWRSRPGSSSSPEGIPFVISRVWRRNTPDGAADQPRTAFSDWWRGDVETWQGRVEGWDAAVEVLMPLGVAAIGMTLIGLIFG